MWKHICILGDSITYGESDTERGGWAERLRERYQQENRAQWLFVLGIPGETTKELSTRLAAEIKAREADVVLIASGINDAVTREKSGPHITEEDFKKNVRTLIAHARRQTKAIAWIGLTRVDESKTSPLPGSVSGKHYRNDRIKLFDDLIASVCADGGVPYLPLRDVADPTTFADGLHPDAPAHKLMAQRVYDFLEQTGFTAPIGSDV